MKFKTKYTIIWRRKEEPLFNKMHHDWIFFLGEFSYFPSLFWQLYIRNNSEKLKEHKSNFLCCACFQILPSHHKTQSEPKQKNKKPSKTKLRTPKMRIP